MNLRGCLAQGELKQMKKTLGRWAEVPLQEISRTNTDMDALLFSELDGSLLVYPKHFGVVFAEPGIQPGCTFPTLIHQYDLQDRPIDHYQTNSRLVGI